jgi:hypothetical protein
MGAPGGGDGSLAAAARDRHADRCRRRFRQLPARQSTLLKENEELRRRQLGTANLLLRQDHLEQENKRLRALLDMRDRQPVEGALPRFSTPRAIPSRAA